MTDPQYSHDAEGNADLCLRRFGNNGLLIDADSISTDAPVHLAMPTAKLLGMIDRLDPDTMRAYLRETIPGDDAEGGITAAAIEHEVPEADSPEDVDEQRDAVQEFASMIIDRLEEFRAAAETPQHFRDCASFAIGVVKGATL